MASKILCAAALGVVIVQVPEMLRGRLGLDWFYVVPLACVCIFLLVMALGARGLGKSATGAWAALALGLGYIVLVAPGLALGKWAEFGVAAIGAAGAFALAVQAVRHVGNRHRVRGALFAAGSAAGGALLLQAAVMRYASHLQDMAPSFGELTAWAVHISTVLFVASCLVAPAATMGERGGRRTSG